MNKKLNKIKEKKSTKAKKIKLEIFGFG